MLRFIDGFSHYTTPFINQKYNNSNLAAIVPGAGRLSGSAMQIADAAVSGGFIRKTLDNQAKWIVGFAIRPSGFPSVNTPIVKFCDAGNVQVDVRVNSDGTLSMTRNGTPLAGGNSTFALMVGGWYFIEVETIFNSSIGANTCQVFVNGVSVINITAGQDTQATSNTTANSIVIAGTAPNCAFSDLYICDGTTAYCNTVLGDSQVIFVLPNGAGDSTEFVATGAATNWQAVSPPVPLGDVQYVSDGTPSDFDLYHLAATGLTGTIFGIQTVMYARIDAAGPRTLAPVLKTGGTVYQGAAFAPGQAYQFWAQTWQVNPNTSVPWIVSDLNALQAGPKTVS